MSQAELLSDLARRLASNDLKHPLRVGIDGICGSGKTTFRRGLAEQLRRVNKPVVEIDSDGFHNPRQIRYRQGRDSARGYYDDAYDFAALESGVLLPLGPGGNRHIVTKIHDLDSDETVEEKTTVEHDAIVLFDCTFLQRGRLRQYWDKVIYLKVERAVARRRGIARDAAAFGGTVAAADAYDRRYLAAWALYDAEVQPSRQASLVIDNTEFDRPRPA